MAKGVRSYIFLRCVDARDIKRYLKGNQHRETKRHHKNGVIGIHKERRLWYATFPSFLRIRRKKAESALGAAMEYNRQMLALFGEDAVLCDVNAAIELDRRRK